MTKKEEYREFLKSQFWRNLSWKKIVLAGERCERCRSPQHLQSHHKFYRSDWYQTQIEDLECLCRSCHKQEHHIQKITKNVFRGRKKGFVRYGTWKKRMKKAGKWKKGFPF